MKPGENKNEPVQKNPWITLSATTVYDNRWITVTKHDVINPAGGKGVYGKVHFKNKAIGIIPIDDEGNTWLVGQFRYTLNEYSWEIPEGGGPLDVPPLDSAKRELKEETGLEARTWHQLMRLHNSNSVTDEEAIIFVAEDLEQGTTELEDSEADLIVKKLPLKKAIDMVMNGEITDSMSVAGLLKIARMKNY